MNKSIIEIRPEKGTTWFVNGDENIKESGDGLTPETAFKTIAEVPNIFANNILRKLFKT